MLQNDAVLSRIEQRPRGLELPLSITLWNGRKRFADGRLAFPATREYIYAG